MKIRYVLLVNIYSVLMVHVSHYIGSLERKIRSFFHNFKCCSVFFQLFHYGIIYNVRHPCLLFSRIYKHKNANDMHQRCNVDFCCIDKISNWQKLAVLNLNDKKTRNYKILVALGSCSMKYCKVPFLQLCQGPYFYLHKVLLPISSWVVHKYIYCTTLGNVARVYPWIVQGLTFLSA